MDKIIYCWTCQNCGKQFDIYTVSHPVHAPPFQHGENGECINCPIECGPVDPVELEVGTD